MTDAAYAHLVRALGDAAIQRTTDSVVQTLRGQLWTLSGDDSGLSNLWLEFATQVQGGETFDWDLYVLHVKQLIEGSLLALSDHELQALALRTPTGRDRLNDEHREDLTVPYVEDEVVDLVYGALYNLAMDTQDDAISRFLWPGSDDARDYFVRADSDGPDDGTPGS